MALCPYCAEAIPPDVEVCPICRSDLTQSPPRAQPPAREHDAVMRMLVPVDRSPWAIAAGYAGLFSMTCILAPVAILLSLVAIWDMKRHPERRGMARAVFGLVMGLIGTVVMLFAIGGELLSR